MTLTASADDSALTQFVHPNIGRVIDQLDQAGTVPPMRLRPAQKMAQMMWAQQFNGDTTALDRLGDELASTPSLTERGLAERKVRTEPER